MARVFVYDDREFPDPDPEMSVEQVKGTLADFYGEIANASVKETRRGDDTIYEFQRRVGTKGAFALPLEPGEVVGWTTCTLAGLLAATPPADLKHHRAHGGAHPARRLPGPGRRGGPARQKDVELACAQAQDYAAATKRLLEAMRWKLRPRRS